MKIISYLWFLPFISLFILNISFGSSIEISDYSVDFGDVEIGEEESYTLDITNIGNKIVSIDGVWLSGDSEFDYYENCEGILEVDDTCSIEVLFMPSDYEDYSSDLIIEYGSSKEIVVDIWGEGSR